ncbi:MAG: ABC transporter permease [Planctomycetota bacterium]|nr:ABC transporter permease [Planctomycetota bacterium]
MKGNTADAPAVSNRLSPGDMVAGTLVIAGRELAAYFDSAIAYVYTIAFALLANSIFMNEFFLTGNVDMTRYFDVMPLLLAFFIPAVTMRLWAEERKQRTVELLLTLPIRTLQAVLGKYLAALGLFTLFLIGSLPIVIMLATLGDPDLGLIFSGYLGLALLGALFLAFGMLLSALSSDQIVAFVTSTVVGFLFVLSGHERVVAVLDGLFPKLALGTLFYESISVMPHYENFVRGVIELSALVWFGLIVALSLWICALVLERNRA